MWTNLASTLHTLFVTPRNLTIVGTAWALVLLVGRIIPGTWLKVYREHVAPALLLVVCSTAVWVPGLRPGLSEGNTELAPGTGLEGAEVGWRIALGIILALAAYLVPIVLMWAIQKYLPPGVAKQLRRVL